MGVNFKVYKDSFKSTVNISKTKKNGKIIKSVTENDPTFKYLHSTWTINPLEEVRL